MAGTKRDVDITMSSHERISGRLIPKRGHVKMAVVVRLAHSFAFYIHSGLSLSQRLFSRTFSEDFDGRS
ncbi:hypothetical protein L484_006378 [Morus notabilis]|uniref:Uncharacterized protein n=1 Tax=Morus notabilis TaxID=981085 RepID=W9RDG7_9ROSA|nr:hypothetical protein L484_006378 [Morus notabilis]